MGTGIALTVLGVALLGAGVGLDLYAQQVRPGDASDFGDVLHDMAAVPLMVCGALHIGVGVPMWIAGGLPGRSTSASIIPSVRLGRRSVSLAWVF